MTPPMILKVYIGWGSIILALDCSTEWPEENLTQELVDVILPSFMNCLCFQLVCSHINK